MFNAAIFSSRGNSSDIYTYKVSNTDPSADYTSLTALLAAETLVAGDVVGLKGGDEFYESISISGISGTSENPITFTSYGTGKAVIKGSEAITGWTNEGGNIWSANVTGKTIYQVTKNNVILSNSPSQEYYVAAGTTDAQIVCPELIGHADLTGSAVHIALTQWVMTTGTVTAFNSGTGTLTVSFSSGGSADADWFYIHNHKNLLDEQDEWAYSATENKLYVYSTSSPTGIEATVLNDNGIYVNNSSYINIDGLTVKDVSLYGIKTKSSSYVTIENNVIDNAYDSGIYHDLAASSTNITVKGNTVKNTNSYGIRIDASNSLIENNTVENIGLLETRAWHGSSYTIGVRSGNTRSIEPTSGDNNIIRGNKIAHTAYNSIAFVGSNTLIEKNFLQGYCQVLPDGGGIYTYNTDWSNPTATNSIIQDNILINEGEHWYKAIGSIYTDDKSHDIIIRRNTVKGGKRGIFLHNNQRVEVYENTVYKTYETGIRIAEDPSGGDDLSFDNVVENNNILVEQPDYFSNNNTFGYALAMTSFGDDTDLASIDSNKVFNPYSLKQFGIRSTTDYWLNSQFHRGLDLFEWRNVTGQDLTSIESDFYWSSEWGYNGFPVQFDTEGVNLIPNGTFDSGSLTGWSAPSGVLSAEQIEGNYVAKITPNPNGSIQCTGNISVTTGLLYAVSFRAKCDTPNTSKLYFGTNNNVTGKNYPLYLTNDWIDYKLIFEAPITDSSFKILIDMNELADVLYIDDVVIKNVTVSETTLPERSFLAYNETNVAKNVSLPIGTWYDFSGSAHSGTISIPANSSQILTYINMIDDEAPAIGVLSYENLSYTTVTLNWTSATDNHSVKEYRLYKDDVLVETIIPSVNTYDVVGLTQNTQYTYKISAVDRQGNVSSFSSQTFTTLVNTNLLEFDVANTTSGNGTLTNLVGGNWSVNRNSSATYIDSDILLKDAASNYPRIDYTGGTSSVVVEPQESSIFGYSEAFSAGYFTKTRSTTTADVSVAPDGTTTADLLEANTSSAFLAYGYRNNIPTANQHYILSAFVKPASSNYTALNVSKSGNTVTIYFDLLNGVKGNVSTLGTEVIHVDSGIEQIGDYYRIWVEYYDTNGTISVSNGVGVTNALNNTTCVPGNSIYVWGINLVQSESLTSYIRSTGATGVTREADVITVSAPAGATQYIEWIDGVEQSPIAISGGQTITMKNGTTKLIVE